MEDNQGILLNNSNTQIEKINYSTNIGRITYTQQNSQDDENKKMKEEIKNLKQTIKAYQTTVKDQHLKISSQDNLVVEYQSLHQNYASIELALNQSKIEIANLREKLAIKDKMLTDFQKVIEVSKSKFEMYEEANMALKLKIEEYDTKLQILSKLKAKNDQLNQKIKELEAKLENSKNNDSKREEIFKVKITGIEQQSKRTITQLEEDISDLRIANEKLKIENEKYKKQAQLANDSLKEKEDYHQRTINDKDKEHQRLLKNIKKMKNDMLESNLIANEKNANDIKEIGNLREENEKLNQIIKGKDDEIEELKMTIGEYDSMFKSAKNDVEQKAKEISNLLEEKESLTKCLNDKQNDFAEYLNSSQKEVSILHNKLLVISKEKENLVKENSEQNEAIKVLKNTIGNYEESDKEKNNQFKSIDKKYDELVKTLKVKEQEFNIEYQKYDSVIKKSQNEIDLIKAKYGKTIQIQKIKIEELNTRVQNLINYFIGLKDYALTLERNLNENMIVNGVANNSMIVTSPYSLNSEGANEKITYSKQLLSGMREMIAKIDSKILPNNNNTSISYNNFDI